MKKKFLLLVTAVLTFGLLISCSKDDETDKNESTNQTLEITGKWLGQDQFGNIFYGFENTSFTGGRNGISTIEFTGTIVLNNPDKDYVIIKITTHNYDATQIGKYIRMSYKIVDSAKTTFVAYSLSNSQSEAEASTTILVSEHTLTKQ